MILAAIHFARMKRVHISCTHAAFVVRFQTCARCDIVQHRTTHRERRPQKFWQICGEVLKAGIFTRSLRHAQGTFFMNIHHSFTDQPKSLLQPLLPGIHIDTRHGQGLQNLDIAFTNLFDFHVDKIRVAFGMRHGTAHHR